MKMEQFHILFVILLYIQGMLASLGKQELTNKLLNITGYNKRVRPVLRENQPVTVKHGIILTDISDINEKQQKMILYVLQRIEWKDELLNWNPADYGGIEEINIDSSYFWVPRLLLYNNADEKYSIERDSAKTRLLINYNGNITWIVPDIFKSSCKINVHYFPLDEQFCTLRIGSWTYGTDKQDIYPIHDHVDISMYSPNGQWELIETRARRQTLRHNCCIKEVAQISYDLHIKRLPLFYITNFILPCALIAALNAMVFLTPAETGEQLAVGVTILLSLVVFFLMVESRVPNTSDNLPLISKYYCCTVIEISAVLAMTCIIHKFEHHGAVPLPPWVKKYIIGHMGRLVFMNFESEKSNVKKITVTERPVKEEESDPIPTKEKKRNSWNTKKSFKKLLEKKESPNPFEGNKDIEVISNRMKEDEQSQALEMQWKHAANILARFMTIVYIFVVTLTFFAIMFSNQTYTRVYPEQTN